MNRRDWYYKQRVTEAEWGDADDQIEAAMWAIVKEVLGYGFLQGANVTEHAPQNFTVDVQWFLGYDQLGRRLELPFALSPENVNCAVDEVGAPTAVVGVGNAKWLAVFIEFDRKLSDPRLDGNGSTVYWKVDEWFKVNVVQSAESPTPPKPPTRPDQVLICDVQLVYGQTVITNSDIDFVRREDFVLTGFLHGNSHRELGADPVPNATPSDGGLMSSVDKTKLDTVTWTGPGVSSLLGLIGRPVNPVNVVAPSGTSLNVSAAMGGYTPGGGPATKGVITNPPDNRVIMRDSDGDDFLDGAGNKVYGRLTESLAVWTLSFFSYAEGVGETAFDMTPYSGAAIVWFPQEVFGLDSFPYLDPQYSIPSDQVAGEVPDATTTVRGKVLLCPSGVSTAGTVCQGNDPRLTGSGAIQLIRKLASRPSLFFMPKHASPYNTYRLHQYHGLAKGDYQTGASPWEPADYYFEYDRSHPNYPLDVFLNGSPAQKGVGLSDNTGVVCLPDTWFYVYLIGRDKSSPVHHGLVVSTNPPWFNGPLLDDSSFQFWNGGTPVGGPNYQGGWRYWKFVGCILQLSGTPWELAQIRKKGNHCEYELGQLLYSDGNFSGVPWLDVSLATRVPPTSMRAFLRARATHANGFGSCEIRPPAGGTMNLKEPPGSLLSRSEKLYAEAWDFTGSGVGHTSDTGWVALNTARQVAFQHNSSGGTDHNAFLEVLGYEEYDDAAATDLTW